MGNYLDGARGMETMKKMLDAIDRERVKQGITTIDIGLLAGCSTTTYRAIYRRKAAAFKTVIAMCEALNLRLILLDKDGNQIA